MREHIYRGKRIDDGEWEYGNLIIDGNFAYIVLLENIDRYDRCEVDPETVGEFTGMRDGKENMIFENDIIQVRYSKEDCTNYLVVYLNVDAGYYLSESVNYSPCFIRDKPLGRNNRHYFKVIGNLTDNPELLEAK